MKKKGKQPIITIMEFVEEPKVNKEVLLLIQGQLPDKAWKIKKEKLEMRTEQKKLIINIPAIRDKNLMAAQEVVRFKIQIPIFFPSEGRWTLICNNVEKKINIIK